MYTSIQNTEETTIKDDIKERRNGSHAVTARVWQTASVNRPTMYTGVGRGFVHVGHKPTLPLQIREKIDYEP